MGEKISDYINSASSNPNTASLLDLSEFDGSSYESVKWQISDFLTWLQNNVSFSEVYTFYNNSGATIEKGTPVLIDSIQGGIVAINDYSIKPNNTTSKIFVAKEQILNGANGVFFQAGLIDDVDTSLYSVGATLYFNYTSGSITNVYASDVIYLGIVITSAVSGSIFVAPEQAQNVVPNIYNDNGTIGGNRIVDGSNNELLFQTMGKFSVHSHANNVDNVVFEVRSQASFESFTIRDHNTGDHLFCIENGKVEINNEYFLPNVDGTAGQVMKTDGLGNVTWQDEATGIGGGGTLNRVAKWTPDGSTLNNSLIIDDGSKVGVGGIGFSAKVYVNSSVSDNQVSAFESYNSAIASGKPSIGLSSVANGLSSSFENIGGRFIASNNSNGNYSLQLKDGTETVSGGRFLKDTGEGKANWVDITASDVSGVVGGSGINERLAVWLNSTTLDETEIYYNVAGGRVGFGANYTPQNRVYIEQTSSGDEPLRVQTVRGDLITANSIVGISNVANSVSGLTNNGVIGVGHGQTDIDSYNIGVTGQAGNIRPTISKKGNIGGLFYTQLGNRTNYGAQFITTSVNTEDNYGIFIENYNLGSGDSHAVWIMDRNEAVGKVLMSRTNDGKGGWEPLPYDVNFACGDEVTPIVVASALTTLRAPRSFKINSVRASLTTAGGTSGVTRFDIKVNGTSILNPIAPLEIDFGDKTSATATNQPIIAISSVFVDSEITVDCTAITGSGTEAGAKIYLIGELE